MKEGDYVLATKYSDGDPGDQWAVGWFSGMLPKLGGDRYMVKDAEGKEFRRNGFRRCEPITHEQGVWFVAHQKEIEESMHGFYYDDDGMRHGRSIWEWLALAPTGDGDSSE